VKKRQQLLPACGKLNRSATFVDHKKRPSALQTRTVAFLSRIYEIHKYRGDSFLYVVARTNKHSEDYVKADVDKMNAMLSPEMKAEGIRYLFALGTVESMAKKTGERTSRKKDKQAENGDSPLAAINQ
jgi:hypothetical protein